MFVSLRRFLSRLDIPDDGTNRKARLLNWITIAICLITVIYSGLFVVLMRSFNVLLFGMCAIFLTVGINVAVRKGHIRIAALVFVLGIWLILTTQNFRPGALGVFDGAFTAYLIPILLAGFLIGSNAGFIFALVSALVGLGILIKGMSTPVTFIEAQFSSQVLHFTDETLFFLIAATLLTLTNRNTASAFKRARSSEENLLIRNRELEREIAERQQVESALRASDQIAKEFQDRLKDLHEISIQLANVPTLDDLHRQAIILGCERLGFDRMCWFVLSADTQVLEGTYGIDTEGNLDDVHDVRTEVSLDNWTNNFQRFTSNGHVYFRVDTILNDRNVAVGKGWNAFAAVSHGDTILGWLAADNLLHQQPLQDYQLELMRLYGAMLGQLFTQKQSQQLLAEKDLRLQLALNAANMRSWDWNLQTGEIMGSDLYDEYARPTKTNYIDFLNNIHSDDRQLVLDAIRAMVELTGIYEVEYRIYTANGAMHWLYSLGQPYRDANGEIVGLAGVTQDITGRKTIEETLKRADKQAMELILEKERVTALTEFISTVSHDFKTPLAIINNSLYLLQRIDDPVKQKDKLNLIKEQTLLLDKQIQDILTISRLDYAPQVISHPVNVNRLLSKIAELFLPSFENKKLTLNLDLHPELPNILADSDELDRALVNLVENAINYTPLGGKITITTRLIDHQIECLVSDTGIGMTPQDAHQIFDNFYRAENARMINSKGTGLGLAIVKRIITNHNGTITVESELGKGTTFHLRFPIMAAVK